MLKIKSDVLIIAGRPETLFNTEDFARILDEKLGPDAAKYFRETLENCLEECEEKISENPLKYCSGECDKLYELERHYQTAIKDALDELRGYYKEQVKLSKPQKLFRLANVIRALDAETR